MLADILLRSTCSILLLIGAALPLARSPLFTRFHTPLNLAFTLIHLMNRLALLTIRIHRFSKGGPPFLSLPSHHLTGLLTILLLDILAKQDPLWLLLPQCALLGACVLACYSSLPGHWNWSGAAMVFAPK